MSQQKHCFYVYQGQFRLVGEGKSGTSRAKDDALDHIGHRDYEHG